MPPSHMSGNRRRASAAVALLVIAVTVAGVTWRVRAAAPRKSTTVAVGKVLPSLVLRDATGRPVDIRTVKSGTRRIVAFYSPTCGVCQQELPELTPFPAALGLVMVNENNTGVPNAFEVQNRNAAHFSDADGAFQKTSKFPSLPTLLFVDERDVVVDGLVGAHPPRVVRAKLEAFAAGVKAR